MSPPKNSVEETEQPAMQRLQKVLAAAGAGSRRRCEEFILAGRVTVDGEVMQDLGVRVDPQRQRIELDFEPIRTERKRYFLLNKPPDYLCTSNDPGGRPRVIDLFPAELGRLFTVGRLDENSQGLLIVTNDGELANRLAHPRYRIPRTYHVQVAGSPNRETLDQLHNGIYFTEGKFRVDRVKRIGSKGKSTFLEIVLRQGKNREIRRLLARVGHKVMHLERVAFGPLKLGRLAPGRSRPLTSVELKLLREMGTRGESPQGDTGRQRSRGGQKATGSRQKAAGRKQSAESSGQKAVGRKQKAAGGKP